MQFDERRKLRDVSSLSEGESPLGKTLVKSLLTSGKKVLFCTVVLIHQRLILDNQLNYLI